MSEKSTHASLFSRLRQEPNQEAWREFDENYRDLIERYCALRGLKHWDADDVRQIVMLRLARTIRAGFRYRPEVGRFRSYLYRVVHSAISAHRSGPQAMLDLEAAAEVPLDETSASDARWEEEWRNHHFRRALAVVRERVSPRSLEIFERLLGGTPVGEVARDLEMTEAAVYKVKQRVRDLVKQEVELQIAAEDEFDS